MNIIVPLIADITLFVLAAFAIILAIKTMKNLFTGAQKKQSVSE